MVAMGLRALCLVSFASLVWGNILLFNTTEDDPTPIQSTVLQYDAEKEEFRAWPPGSTFEIRCPPEKVDVGAFEANFNKNTGDFVYRPRPNEFSNTPSDKDGFTYQVTFLENGREVKRLMLVQVYIRPINDQPYIYEKNGETYPVIVTFPEVSVLDNTNNKDYLVRLEEFFPTKGASPGVGCCPSEVLNVSLPGSDVDGDSIRFEITSAPSNGIVIAPKCAAELKLSKKPRCVELMDSTGSDIVYIPDPYFRGLDNFTYIVNDELGRPPNIPENVNNPPLQAVGLVQLTVGGLSMLPSAACVDALKTNEDVPVTLFMSRGGIEESRREQVEPGLRYFLCDPRLDENALLYAGRERWLRDTKDALLKDLQCELPEGTIPPCSRAHIPVIRGPDGVKPYVNESEVFLTLSPEVVPGRNGTVHILHGGRESCAKDIPPENCSKGAQLRPWYTYTPAPNTHGFAPQYVSEVFFFNIYGIDPTDCLNGTSNCLLLNDDTKYPGGIRAEVLPQNDPPVAVALNATGGRSWQDARVLSNATTSEFAISYIDEYLISKYNSGVDTYGYGLSITITGRDFDLSGGGDMRAQIFGIPPVGELWQAADGQPVERVFSNETILKPDVTRPNDWKLFWGSNASATWELIYFPPELARGEPLTSFTFRVRDNNNPELDEWQPWSAPGRVNIFVACSPGYHKAPGNRCVPCEAGYYSDGTDFDECVPCSPGSYSPGGLPQCRPCPTDTYMDDTNATQCRPCPAFSNTTGEGNTDVTQCRCADGHFGLDGGPCLACPSPSTDDIAVDNPQEAIARRPSTCCEDGDLCWTCCDWSGRYKGLVDEPIWPMNLDGFFISLVPSIEEINEKYGVVEVTRCTPWRVLTGTNTTTSNKDGYPEDLACPALNSTVEIEVQYREGTECAYGYKGTRCAECEDQGIGGEKFYRIFGLCKLCPNDSGQMGLIVGICAALFAPIAFKVADMMGSFTSIGISVGFGQISALFGKIPLDWPDELRDFFDNLSALNLNMELVHPECDTDWDFSLQWTIIMLSPVIVILLLVAVLVIVLFKVGITRLIFRPPIMRGHAHLLVPVGRDTPFGTRVVRRLARFFGTTYDKLGLIRVLRKLFRAMLTFLHLGYVFLAKNALSILDCQENVGDGKLYLEAQPSTQCYVYDEDDEWGALFPYALVAIIAYCFGILALFSSILWSIKGRLERPATIDIIGFIYFRYEGQWYWYEIVILARKMFVVLATVAFSTSGSEAGLRQAVFSMAVLVVAFLLQVYSRPYDSARLDRMEVVSIGAQLAALFCGLVFRAPDSRVTPTFRSVLTVFVTVLMYLAIFFHGVHIALDIFPNLGRSIKDIGVARKRAKVEKRKAKAYSKIKKEGGAALQAQDKAEATILSLNVAAKVKSFVQKLQVGKGGTLMLTAKGERLVQQYLSKNEDKKSQKLAVQAMSRMVAYADQEEELLISKKDDTTFEGRIKKDRRVQVLEVLSRLPTDDNLRAAEFIDEVFKPRNRLGKGASWFDKVIAFFLGGGGGAQRHISVATLQHEARKAERLAGAEVSAEDVELVDSPQASSSAAAEAGEAGAGGVLALVKGAGDGASTSGTAGGGGGGSSSKKQPGFLAAMARGASVTPEDGGELEGEPART